MPRKSSSQWNFGDLFEPSPAATPSPAEPVVPAREVRSVTALTAEIKRLLQREIGGVWVAGEVTNLRMQASGHCYFTLKDATAQLSCVLFRGQKVAGRAALADGRNVLLQGDVTVYEARGQYQLVVTALELQGVGALQLAFEQLKQRLQAEGLFAPERKRPLPRYPRRLGLVTSPAGAAIRDVLHVIQRRHPALEIILAPARVQGAGAAEEIAAALARLNDFATRRPAEAPELILVTRGGGSLEDLWAFNEEAVARAIAASDLPVVSAIGHEIDFTIADFVADLRAATPSAAAELITEGMYSSVEFVAESRARLARLARGRVEDCRDDLEALTHRLRMTHPRRRFNEHAQRLDDLVTTLQAGAGRRLRDSRGRAEVAAGRLARTRPERRLALKRTRLNEALRRLRELVRSTRQRHAARLTQLHTRLALLSPQSVLDRGYSITVEAETGRVVRRADAVSPGTRLRTRFQTGEVTSRVDAP